MSDSHLHSLHLGDNPRRELFRQARLQLEGACGAVTLNGRLEPPGEVDLEHITRTIAPMAPGSVSPFYLQDGEQRHPLVVGINSIGRLPDNTIVIRDEHVSRRHCAVVVHSSGQCEVHDIASKNGTYLNGKKITGPTRLKSGDQLLLCTKKIIFVSELPTPAPAPTPGPQSANPNGTSPNGTSPNDRNGGGANGGSPPVSPNPAPLKG